MAFLIRRNRKKSPVPHEGCRTTVMIYPTLRDAQNSVEPLIVICDSQIGKNFLLGWSSFSVFPIHPRINILRNILFGNHSFVIVKHHCFDFFCSYSAYMISGTATCPTRNLLFEPYSNKHVSSPMIAYPKNRLYFSDVRGTHSWQSDAGSDFSVGFILFPRLVYSFKV